MAKMAAGLLIASILLFLELADGVRSEDLIPAAPTPDSDEMAMFLEDLIGILQNRPPSRRVPPDFFCHSCREVSRKAERFLNDPSLYKEVEKISGEVCHIIRSDLQVKCRKLLELYLREGILFFQIVFLEKNLCNYTGFCPASNRTNSSSSISAEQSPIRLPSLGEINLPSFMMKARAGCDACHVAAEQIRRGLDDHEQQIKIIKALLEACESLPSHANQCKRSVFQYGPLVLGNLQKFLIGNDLCILLRMCDSPAPPPEAAGRLAMPDLPATLRRLLASGPPAKVAVL
ncbi:unnamed protein product [Spirodela intermedia]|uniref:Saposin B-type domain-containing protein n=2 Tax=Spirodela intermedia TaxID=51605 RepID=A0A7I8K930_SPIIN|nr:unnamed protein product [Spirodela intermedia]CAA6658131.1 unnamed protein product [Spirodela intermedia]CAA7394289.1 unnamed protein product [Spirodela intermedia]